MATIAVDVVGRDQASDDLSRVSRNAEKLGRSGQQVGRGWKGAGDNIGKTGTQVGKLGTASSKSGGLLSKLGGIGGVVSKVLGPVGLALSAAEAGQKLLEFGADSVRAGSDLQQSLGAADAIFKEKAGTIQDAALGASQSVGLARSEYLQLAATLGSGLKNKGITDYADQTKNLIGLGADLAAQFGGSTQQAVEAIGSLMRGETDPIEKYGVSINQAAIQAEALASGLVKPTKNQEKITAAQNRATVAQRKYNEAVKKYGKDSTQALSAQVSLGSANSALAKAMEGSTPQLTDQQKAMAALSLLSKQTADAQGTFGRESDTLAGQQQRLTASVEDLKAKIGTALLPILTPLVSAVNQIVTGTGQWGAAAQKVGALLQSMFGPAVQAVIAAVQDVGKTFTDAVGGPEALQSGMAALVPIIEQVGSMYGQYLAGVIGAVVGILGGLIKVIITTAKWTSDLILKVAKFGKQLSATPTGQGIFAAIKKGLDAVKFAGDFARGVMRLFGQAISSVGKGVFDVVARNVRGAGDAARNAVGFIRDIGSKIVNVPLGPFGSIASNIRSIVGAAQSAIDKLGQLAAKVASSPIGKAVQGIAALGRAEGGVLIPAPAAARRIVINNQVAPPTVVIDGPSLRAVVRSELRALVGTRRVSLA